MIISFAKWKIKRNDYQFCKKWQLSAHHIPNIKIDGIDVEQVDHAKLLGVTISHDLSWNKHVENIVKKAGKRLYMMYQLKRAGISQSDLVTVYLSVVRPYWNMVVLCGTRNDTEKSIKMYFPRCKLCWNTK